MTSLGFTGIEELFKFVERYKEYCSDMHITAKEMGRWVVAVHDGNPMQPKIWTKEIRVTGHELSEWLYDINTWLPVAKKDFEELQNALVALTEKVKPTPQDLAQAQIILDELRAKIHAEPVINPAEALYAFAGWLTSREAVFSSKDNAAQAAELVDQFCKSQGWEVKNERFSDLLKPYPA